MNTKILKIIISITFCLLFNVTFSNNDKDTVKILYDFKNVDFSILLQRAAFNIDYQTLSKNTDDTLSFSMKLSELSEETLSKYDVFEILNECEKLFKPDSLTLYISKDVDSEGFNLYVIELKRLDGLSSHFIFAIKNKKIKKVIITR